MEAFETEQLDEVKEVPEEEESDTPNILISRNEQNDFSELENINLLNGGKNSKLEMNLDNRIQKSLRNLNLTKNYSINLIKPKDHFSNSKNEVSRKMGIFFTMEDDSSDEFSKEAIKTLRRRMKNYFSCSLLFPLASDDPAIDSEQLDNYGDHN